MFSSCAVQLYQDISFYMINNKATSLHKTCNIVRVLACVYHVGPVQREEGFGVIWGVYQHFTLQDLEQSKCTLCELYFRWALGDVKVYLLNCICIHYDCMNV